MICKKIDFRDEEFETDIIGYVIETEDEIIVLFEGYNKKGLIKFKNLEEIVQELIRTKELLNISDKMLDDEMEKTRDMEEILIDLIEKEQEV